MISRTSSSLCLGILAVAIGWAPCPLLGQDAPPAQPAGPAKSGYRQLAPGVMKSVKPELLAEDTFSRHDVV